MRTTSLALIASSLLACNCFAATPSFPAPAQIGVLTIPNGKSISDPSTISGLLAVLGEIKSGWGYTWHTYPSPKARIYFHSQSGQAICRLDIGTNWVGSDCGVELKSDWPPYAKVTSEQARFLKAFVTGTWEVK
jgi:hypothetical protein